MNRNFIILFFTVLLFCFCTNSNKSRKEIVNPNRGLLKATHKLSNFSGVDYLLDSVTAPRPKYIQLFTKNGDTSLAILNSYNNSVYLYDFRNGNSLDSLKFHIKNLGQNQYVAAFHMKSIDSVYLYTIPDQRVLLVNKQKNELESLSLIEDLSTADGMWSLKFPQHVPTAASPFFQTENEILFQGQYMWAIPSNILKKFKFTARLNFDNTKVAYVHNYPSDLYDKQFGWDDQVFSAVFSDYNPITKKMIYSFPVSHDLFVGALSDKKLEKLYGGSNFAETIPAIPENIAESVNSRELLIKYITSTDLYCAIKFDKFRNVYYRFLRKSLKNVVNDKDWRSKKLSVIIMDDKFKYLGETEIGTLKEWNWENSFVTEKGLYVEHTPINSDESKLRFRIFKLNKL